MYIYILYIYTIYTVYKKICTLLMYYIYWSTHGLSRKPDVAVVPNKTAKTRKKIPSFIPCEPVRHNMLYLLNSPSGWWLGHPSEKYEFVNWDDEIPNIWEHKKCSKPPTKCLNSPNCFCVNLDSTPLKATLSHLIILYSIGVPFI